MPPKTQAPPLTFNAAHTAAFIDALMGDFAAGCSEIRAFGAAFRGESIVAGDPKYHPKTLVGYFESVDAFTLAAGRLSGVSGYVTVNPVKRELMARADNTFLKAKKDEAAKDADISFLRWAYLDIDPIRPSRISATQGEMEDALGVRDKILQTLPQAADCSIWGNSGNGGFILVRLPDYPNDAHHKTLIERFNRTVRALFNTKTVEIDRKTCNASRVMCLPGTMKCKGSHRPDRPWRLATLDHATFGGVVDLERWIVEHEVKEVPPRGRVILNGNGHANGKAPALALSVYDRASLWVARKEPAIDKQGGSAKTFDVAMDLIQGFDLPYDQAMQIMQEYSARCLPPWSDAELQHKLEDADRKDDSQGRPRGWLRDAAPKQNGYANGQGHANGRGAGHGHPGLAGDDPRPDVEAVERLQIPITTREHEAVALATFALGEDEAVYQRGNLLVKVQGDGATNGTFKARESLQIALIPKPQVRTLLSKVADWITFKPTKEGDLEPVPAHPPVWAVDTIFAQGSWPSVRYLEAVVASPVLRGDGTVLEEQGYDRPSGILYQTEDEFPRVPAFPSLREAQAAKDRLFDVVADFPFKTEVHRASWLAALLTPVARYAITGPCPMFLMDANVRGAGKSLLCDIIGLITLGRAMARTAYSDNDDEMRKRITAMAMAGDRTTLLDNIGNTFGGPSIDAALTGTIWRDRILGVSGMTPEMPLLTVWYGNGNNLVLKGDALRRVVYTRIECELERPEEREGYRHADLPAWVAANRTSLLVDCLTILRSFVTCGRPRIPKPPMGTYESWSALVRSAVYFVTDLDPCDAADELRTGDPETGTATAILEGWSKLPSGTSGLTCAHALKILKNQDDNGAYDGLREALAEWATRDEMPSPRAMGMRLKKIKGRMFGSRKFDSYGVDGTQYWRVSSPDGPPAAGREPATQGEASPEPIINFDESDYAPDF